MHVIEALYMCRLVTSPPAEQSSEGVVMTRGEKGAILSALEGCFEHPGVPVTVVDTVGAGDSFTSSMTLGLLAGKEYAEILSDACKVAAEVCSHAGAVPE